MSKLCPTPDLVDDVRTLEQRTDRTKRQPFGERNVAAIIQQHLFPVAFCVPSDVLLLRSKGQGHICRVADFTCPNFR
eukprot:4505531-Amphidinium_carterae.2